MKMRSLVTAVTAFSVLALAAGALSGASAETRVTNLSKKYSKLQLEAICIREGGSSYGNAGGSYGCSTNKGTVECQNDGTCKGYNDAKFVSASSRNHSAANAEMVLEMQSTPTPQGKTGGMMGVTVTP